MGKSDRQTSHIMKKMHEQFHLRKDGTRWVQQTQIIPFNKVT